MRILGFGSVVLFLPSLLFAAAVPTGPEFQVNTYVTGEQAEPAVAVDGSGNFIVTWLSGDANGPGVFAQRYDATGTPVGGEFRVSNPAFQGPFLNDVVVARPGGGFVVAWNVSYLLGDHDVMARIYDSAATPLGPPFQVNTFTTDDQLYPALATAGSGNFVVVWQSYTSFVPNPLGQDGDRAGIFAQRFDATGTPVGAEFQVNTYTTSDQTAPAVAFDGTGRFVVVWDSFYQGTDPSGGIFGQRFDATGAPIGGEFHVNTYLPGGQGAPAVVAGVAGNFVVTWSSGSFDAASPNQDGSASGIFARRFDSTGAPVGGEFQVNTYTSDVQYDPALAVDAAGDFVVVWTSGADFAFPPHYGRDASLAGVSVQRYDAAGVPVGGETVVNTFTTQSQFQPAVASGPGGNFVVTWASRGQDNGLGGDRSRGIFAQRFTTACGDGTVDAGEQCDDGANVTGDGCDARCDVEACFTCAGAPSSCAPIASCADADGCCPAGCSLPSDHDCKALISGQRLRIEQTPNQVIFVTHDAQIDTAPGTGIDPVADGAYLQVYDGVFGSACFWLRTNGSATWVAKGSGANRVFKYTDRDAVNGPCGLVLVRGGRFLRAHCKDIQNELRDFFPPQDPFGVRFKSGATEYCGKFGGAVQDYDRLSVGRHAPAPVACPDPPFPCP